MTTDKSNTASDPQPAELAEQQGVALPRLPEACEAEFAIPGASPVSVYTAEQMQEYARAALAARQPGAQEQVTDAEVDKAWNRFEAALHAPEGDTPEDRVLSLTIDQRDRYNEVADELADHIARITGTELGEHSSVNCPWQNAIEAAESYTHAQGIDLGQLRVIELLLTVAEAAYTLADNSSDMEDCENVEYEDFVALSDALDALDELPDDQPGYTMHEPAKARWALRALIDQRAAAPGVSP